MSYPLIIKDNFFSDPDAIVNIINHVDYSLSSNNYPGVRTKSLDEINPKLYEHIFQKIFLLLHDQLPLRFESNLKVGFHKIKPFVEGDKWDKKNRGWVHKDGCLFGGVIYLDKNPDKDAGTSIYKSKDGFDVQTQENIDAKELFYSGQLIDDGHYYNAYDRVRNHSRSNFGGRRDSARPASTAQDYALLVSFWVFSLIQRVSDGCCASEVKSLLLYELLERKPA